MRGGEHVDLQVVLEPPGVVSLDGGLSRSCVWAYNQMVLARSSRLLLRAGLQNLCQ